MLFEAYRHIPTKLNRKSKRSMVVVVLQSRSNNSNVGGQQIDFL